MDINNLTIATTTQMELMGLDGRPTGVTISGYTPDSKEWRQAQRQYNPQGSDKLSMRVDKKDGNTIDLPKDPNAYENRIKMLAAVVTNIEGLTSGNAPWVYTKEATLALFANDGCAWIVDAWEDHLEKRTNFLKPTAPPANSGSDASHGSTQPPAEAG